MTINKSVVLVMLIALCISAVGITSHASEKEEVLVWVWSAHSTELFNTWFDKVTELFEEENPGLTLRFGFSGAHGGESLIAAVAGGVPPDVYLVNATDAQALYDRGVISDLNSYIDQTPHMSLDNFVPASVQFGQKDGKVFGIPWSLEARAILYNRWHLEEAGLDIRRENLSTWDDVVTYGRRLVRYGDTTNEVIRSGFILGGGTTNFAAYLYANGGEFYNETGTAVAFNDSKGIEVAEMMARFFNEYNIGRKGAPRSDIISERASMVISDTSAVSAFVASAPDYADWLDMALIPTGSQGERSSTILWSNMFVIPQGVKSPDNAWKFFELWHKPEVQEAYFVHFGGISIRSPRLDFFQSDAFFESMRSRPYMEIQPDIFTYAKPIPYIRQGDIGAVMGPLLTQVEQGTLDPASALAEAERVANTILSESR